MPLKTCKKGHQFYKTSDCPTCPICEKDRKPAEGFMSKLSDPARRALESKQIDRVEKLAEFTEKEILLLHGMGKNSIPKLKEALEEVGLTFKSPE
ncbi:RNA polymerase alpha subunit C-terminal domain-containing protein [Algoriphagus sp. D3-2-R+10]|uniref:RNA polymerase alpha subunit C-terminal domain-containing protein n=1 Tax=Algoriphagus aurantiacus TaxID=3103948 RepID=UPI002B3921FE|nr:RNA polymerase alpha subunit C-terminal domain-containing protein [Algoriphagus sp. D3-2-R+10]MEB2777725.1 RNA polymerase alpha subunit C-terminal domain-containing protein [Algoriphagus sp. D3-2-R+10]